jgi:hypothetical protein
MVLSFKKYYLRRDGAFPVSTFIGNVVDSFKSGVTKWAHQNDYNNFKWQPRFYDRIIRNEKELYLIRKYIEENPFRWEIEKNYPQNLEM